jgi:hypothetical protein
MRKQSVNKIKLKNETVDIEVTGDMIDSYKKSTNKKRITKKGMENYFNNLIHFMSNGLV